MKTKEIAISQTKLLTFDSFVFLANFFFRNNGMYAYDRLEGGKKKRTWLELVVFYVSMININIVLLGEYLYVVRAFVKGENFLEATMAMAYIGFAFVGEIKIITIILKKKQLTEFMRELFGIFPMTLQVQNQFVMRRYWKHNFVLTIMFSTLSAVSIWTYNLFAIVSYLLYDVWLGTRDVGKTFPYFVVIPFEWEDNWKYYLVYAAEDFAGWTAAAGIISTDLLLCAVAIQIIMHYDHVKRSIENYQVLAKGSRFPKNAFEMSLEEERSQKDLKFIGEMIAYHAKVLGLSDKMNDVFGVSLLINFLISSSMICIVGFQMTLGTTTTEMQIKWFLFLALSLVQVYLICHYGQMLIDSSTGIADAAYNHNWNDADIRYKKMLVLIAERAQKPAILKATSFVNVSRTTMTDIMQISYKFFAVLREMYAE